jgi:Primase C terminal 1 (PriCT-1)/Bifunctional DNA primase/polymerase, N-terminal
VAEAAPSIDVRGDGGFAIVPPHPSGKRYAWSLDSGNAIAAAPDWLLDRAIGHSGNGKCATPASEWREIVRGVPEGRRDCTAARLTGHLLRKYVDLGVTRELIHCWNLSRNQPPLPTTDIDRIVDSIAGKETKRRGNG